MIQRQAYNICGVTDIEYRNWCKTMGFNMKHEETKKSFYWRILTGRLVRNEHTGRIEKHRAIKGMQIEW